MGKNKGFSFLVYGKSRVLAFEYSSQSSLMFPGGGHVKIVLSGYQKVYVAGWNQSNSEVGY